MKKQSYQRSVMGRLGYVAAVALCLATSLSVAIGQERGLGPGGAVSETGPYVAQGGDNAPFDCTCTKIEIQIEKQDVVTTPFAVDEVRKGTVKWWINGAPNAQLCVEVWTEPTPEKTPHRLPSATFQWQHRSGEPFRQSDRFTTNCADGEREFKIMGGPEVSPTVLGSKMIVKIYCGPCPPPHPRPASICPEEDIRFTVLRVGMTAYRPTTELPAYRNPFPKTAVPEEQEETPGAGVRVNGDDDNGNSTADRNDTTVNNENDLIEVELKAEPYPTASGLAYVLKRNSSSIKVWDSQTKGTAILDSGTEAAITFSAATRTVWVEDPSGGNADLELVARSGSTDVCSDKVHFYSFQTIVVGLSGEVWPGGDPLANGMYNVAQELYERGYDIHYYDEDVVDADGAGAAYNEVVSAIQNRSVSRVAIYGHSHGGGSTHDLAERLDNNRATIGTFTTPATAYVDAIENDSDYDMDSELRLPPPATQAHLNYYQPNGMLHGGVVPGAQNLDVTTTQWGQNLDHGTIDNDANVINAVRDHVLQVQP